MFLEKALYLDHYLSENAETEIVTQSAMRAFQQPLK